MVDECPRLCGSAHHEPPPTSVLVRPAPVLVMVKVRSTDASRARDVAVMA
jgi:hypothetical protein